METWLPRWRYTDRPHIVIFPLPSQGVFNVEKMMLVRDSRFLTCHDHIAKLSKSCLGYQTNYAPRYGTWRTKLWTRLSKLPDVLTRSRAASQQLVRSSITNGPALEVSTTKSDLNPPCKPSVLPLPAFNRRYCLIVFPNASRPGTAPTVPT